MSGRAGAEHRRACRLLRWQRVWTVPALADPLGRAGSRPGVQRKRTANTGIRFRIEGCLLGIDLPASATELHRGHNRGPASTGPYVDTGDLGCGGRRRPPCDLRQRVLKPRLRAVAGPIGGRSRRGWPPRADSRPTKAAIRPHRSGRVDAPIHVRGNVDQRNRVRSQKVRLTRCSGIGVVGPIILLWNLDPNGVRRVAAKQAEQHRTASGIAMRSADAIGAWGSRPHSAAVTPRRRLQSEFATRLAAEQFDLKPRRRASAAGEGGRSPMSGAIAATDV